MDRDCKARLRATFFQRPTAIVAVELLGMTLCSLVDGRLASGRIVETEAYLPEGDSACHCVRGPTPSNRSMFEAAGTTYVYPIHSRYCFNIATQELGEGTAVLIRAIQPSSGIDVMLERRRVERLLDLCRGPARLCEAMGIDRIQDGIDLTTNNVLWIVNEETQAISKDRIVTTPRIGVTSANDLPLRFAIAESPYVSGPLRLRRHK